MDRGIYSASSGGLLNTRRLDVVSNNLANASTVGFKAERLRARQQEFADTLASIIPSNQIQAKADHERTPGVVDVETVTDFTPGPISYTGNPLNVALRKENHFFVVGTPDGESYTRAGNFTLDATGNIVTPDGFPVFGDGGPLTLPEGSANITASGSVIVNGQEIGRLRVVEIPDLSQLERKEGVRFAVSGGATPQSVPADVVPASVEMPNISVVEAMVEMIDAQRGFEAYTKTVKTIDELNDRAIRTARAG